MNYDVNVSVYGKGKKLIGEYTPIVSADSADVAAEKGRGMYVGKGDAVIVRGVYPSLIQEQEPVQVIQEPKKRGRPRAR